MQGPVDQIAESVFADLQRVFSEAHNLTRSIGAELLVLFVPSKFRVYHDIIELPETSDLGRWRTNDLPDRLGQLLREVSPEIGYVDLTPVLEAEARDGRMVYFPDDTHWSPQGHRTVARTLAALLESNDR
jgi:hypothetical protein